MFATHPHPSPMYPRFSRAVAFTAVLGAAVVVLISVIAHNSGAPTTVPSAARSHVMPLTLGERVLGSTAIRGFVRTAPPARIHTTARLERLGFVAGVDEQLHGLYPQRSEALSVVEQFHSATGARAELAHQRATLASTRGQHLTRFGVAGIPDAVGWSVADGRTRGLNVVFTSGSFYYLVGAGTSGTASGAPTRASLIAAAQSVYLTANGCVAMSSRAHPAS
jgi:hypothetical protein